MELIEAAVGFAVEHQVDARIQTAFGHDRHPGVDGGIVQVGEPMEDVRDKCGEPVAVTPEHSDGYDVWIYQVGESKYMYYLGFLNGQLDRIVSRPCVNNDPDCYDAR